MKLNVKSLKKEINNILKQHSEFLIYRTRQRYHFNGSRPSHLLAMKIRSKDHFAGIPCIRSAEGNITTEPKQINRTFSDFYSTLYKVCRKTNICVCKKNDIKGQNKSPVILTKIKALLFVQEQSWNLLTR